MLSGLYLDVKLMSGDVIDDKTDLSDGHGGTKGNYGYMK
jgi:hypothetical protein